MKTLLFFMLGMCSIHVAQGQLTLEACQQRAQANYPLVAQYDLIRITQQYDLSNANKGYLPQFVLTAKATYQSDVTALPITLSGVEVPSLSKDQYQVAAEVNQVIWDGGDIRSRKEQIKASSQVQQQQQHVDMYAIRERVNTLFFGILLLKERLELNTLYDEELVRNYRKIESFIAGGVAHAADLNAVRVEQLSNRQQRVELETVHRAYRQMLGAFIQEEIEGVQLVCPTDEQEPLAERIDRPELQLFTAQDGQLDAQIKQLNAGVMPHLNFFIQGAYGRPGLNMLQNQFKPFAVGGIRFSWNFGSYYTRKDNLRKIESARNSIHAQRQTFLFNTRQQIVSENGEIEKYRRTLTDDDEIIVLREKIQRSSEAQVAEGTMSVIDYMQEVTKTETARQNRLLHRMQLLLSIENLKNTTNN